MTDTTAAWLAVMVLGLVAFAVYLAAENASTIRAWVERDPFDLDAADARAHGRCARPNCRINHDAYRGQR